MLSFLRKQRRRRKISKANKNDAQFPARQLFVLALCRICEPISFMSIFPYGYFMVQSFNITKDEDKISFYHGMLTSAFTFAEFLTGVMWGRVSDVVGRKPILLTGLAGTGLSMLVFGFAPTLQVALFARALGGLLNGNIGVLQTTVAEVVKVKEHQPRAYSIMPFVWCLGSIIGSGLGGTLAEPVKNFPGVFSRGSLFDKYPFLLPNLICAGVVLFGLIIGILFLEETHDRMKNHRDYGLELGSWILRHVTSLWKKDDFEYTKINDAKFDDESAFLIENNQTLVYSSTESSPQLRCTSQDTSPSSSPTLRPLDIVELVDDSQSSRNNGSHQRAFHYQVILHIIAYGLLAFHTITFEQLMPVMLSMEKSDKEPSLPFKFTGGFGLASSTIGIIYSSQGIFQMVAQLIVFPFVVGRLGSLKTFRMVCILYPLLYVVTPYLVLLPDSWRMPGLILVLIWKVTFHSLAYPSNALLLTNSAPSMLVLGTINGVAASTASLCRALGPTISGAISSAGLKAGYLGLAWWVSGIVCIISAIESFLMTEPRDGLSGRFGSEKFSADENDEPASKRHSLETSVSMSSESTLFDPENIPSIVEKIETWPEH